MTARLASLAERSGVPELEGLRPEFHALPREDYATSWRKTWKPFRVGKLAVIPDWSDLEPRADDDEEPLLRLLDERLVHLGVIVVIPVR